MQYRVASKTDSKILAAMNQQLIQDERHRNSMSLAQLQQRMDGWLDEEYQVIVFEEDSCICGYALFRDELEHIYLRHFFVSEESRRKGIGRAAISWLCSNVWQKRIRLEVLTGNEAGIAFWKSVGFGDYSLTLEKENAS